MKRQALVSVSDKTGVVEFAKELINLGFEIISTGGTFSALEAAGVKCTSISDITHFPECLDGRVKTLHPKVHAGILAMRASSEHMEQLSSLNIDTIDVVAVNLYPFKQTISKPDVSLHDAIENIDIGGPTMIRSAAKNYQDVYAVCDPSDYSSVIEDIKSGSKNIDFKFNLMYKVYQHTAYYDTLIANFLREKQNICYPDKITFAYEKVQDLRYGENPHQHAAFYKEDFKIGGTLSEAVQLHGKELSFNNINDTNSAIAIVKEFSEPCVVAVKHSNPCGVGTGSTIYEAYKKAYEVDKISIFGGIIAANDIVDELAAEEINKIFIEIVIAKGYTEKALEILKQKKNIRILELRNIDMPFDKSMADMKKVGGGLLIQQYDDKLYNQSELVIVTKTKPTKKQLLDLEFSYKVVKHTKSNAIVLAKDGVCVGIGAGQTNRIWATEQAIEHAGEKSCGAVLASDAFFPFSDCVEVAYKSGVVAIIQPGGSIRDQDSIDLCDKYGITMAFCKMRHFKH